MARRARTHRTRPARRPAPVAGVALTHPDKLLWPEAGLTKADLARYFRAAAHTMLPHLRDRPLTLVRCPDGVDGGCFFQKHAGRERPAAVDVVNVPEVHGQAPYLTVRSTTALVSLAQIGALELHVAGVRADQPGLPDRLVLDLDPAPDVPFARVMDTARELRQRLAQRELPSFVMTTGGKGLHVVVPLERRHAVQEVADFAADLARTLEREQPERFVARAAKAARGGRIFIDWLRNARGATAVAPYSPRARPGAPVAVPLAWEELQPGLAPDAFTIPHVLARLARRGRDPWAGYARAHGRLPARKAPVPRR